MTNTSGSSAAEVAPGAIYIVCPPLTITRDQADFAVDTIEDCIRLAARAA